MTKEIILFTTSDKNISLSVPMSEETVWLSQAQMSELFGRDIGVISRHIKNIFREEELEEKSNLQKMQITNSDKAVNFYSLDVIISVGYRVKSKRGIEFRKWANSILKDYIVKGYAANTKRLDQLGKILSLMERAQSSLDAEQVLDVIKHYNSAFTILDDYDHQNLKRPKGNVAHYVLTYEDCLRVIDKMRFNNDSDLFGTEKDKSFKSSISAIYQTFSGKELYPSLEEKAANLLYFITKNHSFNDGNKRIAATIFLYFLDKNNVLFKDGHKILSDHTLVALTLLVAESNPKEKETMVSLIMNCLVH